jgi:hypothetical protein
VADLCYLTDDIKISITKAMPINQGAFMQGLLDVVWRSRGLLIAGVYSACVDMSSVCRGIYAPLSRETAYTR